MPGVCGGLTDILLGLPVCIVCLCSGLHRVDTGFASGRLFLGCALYRGNGSGCSMKMQREAAGFS